MPRIMRHLRSSDISRTALLAVALVAFACGRSGDRPAAAQQPRAAGDLAIGVDPRVELISILCRLAGYAEYSKPYRTPYLEAVDRHFASFRGHAAVRSTAGLKARWSIGYNAPMDLAIYLDESFHAVRPLDPLPEGMDSRWRGAPIEAYLEEIRDFAQVSGFAEFYAAQQPYYGQVEGRFRAYLADKPIVGWFDAVFGPRAGASYKLIPGPLVYPMNYAAVAHRADGSEEIAQVMFLEETDEAGLPRPGETTWRITVHEMAHSYVNPIFDARLAEIEPAAAPAFARVEQAMKAQAYPSVQLMVDESVVRAVTVLYLREKSTAAHVERVLADEKQRSFLWIDELVAALAAVREKRGGRLPADDMVPAARDALGSPQSWRR
jgi:hypothetical protein